MANLQILGDQNHARFGGFTAMLGAGGIMSFGPGDALPNRTLIIMSGWTARQRWLPDGRRQILKLNLPGDVCGIVATARSADPPVALTQAQAVLGTFAAIAADESLLRDGPAIPLRAILEFEEWCVFNQLLRLGAMNAKERMAHLLLGLYHPLASVRLGQDWG